MQKCAAKYKAVVIFNSLFFPARRRNFKQDHAAEKRDSKKTLFGFFSISTMQTATKREFSFYNLIFSTSNYFCITSEGYFKIVELELLSGPNYKVWTQIGMRRFLQQYISLCNAMFRKFVIQSMRLGAEMRALARMSEITSFNRLYVAQNSHFCQSIFQLIFRNYWE